MKKLKLNLSQEQVYCLETEKEMDFDLEAAIENYGNSLLRLSYLYLKDQALAEDAVQDTFLKAYKGYSNFHKECSEKTWITRIAINVCKDYLRKSWFKHKTKELVEIPIWDKTEEKEQREDLILEIMKLSPKYKEVILLFYYQELKINEIAQILSIPIGTVSTRLKRAREQMKKNMRGWYYDEP